MLYVKNVPPLERVIRIVMGAGLLAASLLWLGPNAKGWIVGAMGVMAAGTGLMGWCPACAMAGRRLGSRH